LYFCTSKASKEKSNSVVQRAVLALKYRTLGAKISHLYKAGNGFYRFLLALRGSCTHRRGAALLQALVPLRQDSADGVPPAALCTWLCEVQVGSLRVLLVQKYKY
jgi:hypothetical protein